jgi:adenylate kinase
VKIVIFGPQGAGKGTQSARIAEKFGIVPISTGDIFRWAIREGSKLGDQVKAAVEDGRLVPDELTVKVVRERLEQDDLATGWILDGFPRNEEQARALDVILEDQNCTLDAALILDVPQDVSLRRILGRRVCSNCGRNYHIDNPPQQNWTCDRCGGEVVKRTDDFDEAAVRKRLDIYHQQTEPLKAYYEKRGILHTIDGQASPDEVFNRIVEAL